MTTRPRLPKNDAALEELARRVKARREELGLSYRQLTENSDLHFTWVQQLETRTRNPSLTNLLKLAKALEIDVADLIRDLPPE